MMKQSRTFACALTLTLFGAAPLALAETTLVGGTGSATEITGKVMVVNQDKRMLTIKTPEGEYVVLHMPPEVQRLEEIKIGNRLTITETDFLVVDLVKDEGQSPMTVVRESEIIREPGEKPDGAMVETLTVTGVVKTVNQAKGEVTIKGPMATRTYAVEDPAVLADFAPGDGVIATYVRVIRGKVSFE
jgi:hypothetical protein